MIATASPAAAPTRQSGDPEVEADTLLFGLRDASLGYGGKVVLRGVNLQVRAGEFWCLLGPNGEGKTTLVKTLLGALRPRRGQLHREPAVFRRGRVSYVPQRCESNPVLPTSVLEFVGGGLVGVRADAARRAGRLRRALALVGLASAARRNFWTLSGGQRQRAMVARALVRDPRLLVLDEPVAGLDFSAAASVLAVLRDLHQTWGVTIVLVTHELETAKRHATHAALFRGGAVAAGPAGELLTEERLAATFGVAAAGVEVDAAAGSAAAAAAVSVPELPPPARPAPVENAAP
ncbi:metal ABC transporter ATP-binding protein [Phycisphaera mikurensis]|uniref:ABC transporter ATP-binding protein n=1 Tax=Phycisphaera mikurensis (strain NBRC 102666 / KCTC 22515 / FYK2301M01) TaxID=1142394 RepID=I0IEM9_PHYMF|nr:ATP-binding cassette domain-containing protein [Phycisphaera mikurensis]MBB6441515.1 ABC-type Mn2+/Zn2+ transport system ATPase subunit [Phycisphaera mikurensis]BAM03717.1 ABC transporter ATP-binding protein [Phycisphaera mikurensis NBRC 102666]